MSLRYAAIRATFELLWASQLPRLVRRLSKARGVIFTLHRVLPEQPADFSPNAILQVTPDFLAYAITRLRELGLEIVHLDEALRRVEAPAPQKPFAVLTFDDAYRDNLRHALPVLRRLRCPFTLYVPTAFVDGVGEVWWQALEDIVAAQEAVSVTYMGETDYIACGTLAEKHEAYDQLYRRMRAMPEPDRVKMLRELAAQYGFDLAAHCRELIMDWTELAHFAAEGLCTLGAHTVHHYELAKLDAGEARNEIEQSVRIMHAQFGSPPQHLSYPIGGRASAGPREFAIASDLGFRSAVTTRPGALYHHHAAQVHALPRISLNGYFQARRYVDVFAAPAIFSHLPG
jgi:peptidoglycan/xylan/chitin deacetylase (PgdA/CDA1 family)